MSGRQSSYLLASTLSQRSSEELRFAIGPDGDFLALSYNSKLEPGNTGPPSANIVIWSLGPKPKAVLYITLPSIAISSVLWSTDAPGAAFFGHDGSIFVLLQSPETAVRVAIVETEGGPTLAAAFRRTRDGHLLAVASSTGIKLIKIISETQYERRRQFGRRGLPADDAGLVAVNWESPDNEGNLLWTVYRDGTVFLYDTDTGNVVYQARPVGWTAIAHACFSGSRLAIVDSSRSLQIVDLKTNVCTHVARNVTSCALFQEGGGVLYSHASDGVILSHVGPGEPRTTLRGRSSKSTYALAEAHATIFTASRIDDLHSIAIWRMADSVNRETSSQRLGLIHFVFLSILILGVAVYYREDWRTSFMS